MVKTKCGTCSKEFTTHYAWYKKRKNHFCSKACMGIWRSKNIRGKNHPQYKKESHQRICERCKRVFAPHNKKSRFCSYKCKGESLRNNHHGRSKLTGHGYGYIHFWLRKEFGNAIKCENYYCEQRSTQFQWSLLRDMQYEKKRENFWQLCKRCHIAYDAPKLVVSLTKIARLYL